jgi:hypothetical protein
LNTSKSKYMCLLTKRGGDHQHPQQARSYHTGSSLL